MADEKILDDELMTEEELDKVAGGCSDELIDPNNKPIEIKIQNPNSHGSPPGSQGYRL